MNNLVEFFKDKTLNAKAKTEHLSKSLIEGSLALATLLEYGSTAKDPEKGTCMEALEYATKQSTAFATDEVWAFATGSLTAGASRVKWEAAKVIGNIASRFPENLDEPVPHLLANATDPGTVVRWSVAFALGEILKLKTSTNQRLLPEIEAILAKEEKNSIRKIYLAALKSIG